MGVGEPGAAVVGWRAGGEVVVVGAAAAAAAAGEGGRIDMALRSM